MSGRFGVSVLLSTGTKLASKAIGNEAVQRAASASRSAMSGSMKSSRGSSPSSPLSPAPRRNVNSPRWSASWMIVPKLSGMPRGQAFSSVVVMISSIGTSRGSVVRLPSWAIASRISGRKYSSPRMSEGGFATVGGRSSDSKAPSSSHRPRSFSTAELLRDRVGQQRAVQTARAGARDDVDPRQRARELEQLDVRRVVAADEPVELVRRAAHPDRQAHAAGHHQREPQLLEVSLDEAVVRELLGQRLRLLVLRCARHRPIISGRRLTAQES